MLKQLMIAKKIEKRKSALLLIEEKVTLLSTRSAELETAINEAETDEEIKVVEDEVVLIESEKAELEAEKLKLQDEINGLEEELEEIRSNEPAHVKANKTGNGEYREKNKNEGDEIYMTRQAFFGGLSRERAESLVTREEVKEFLEKTRGLISEKRAVTGADLTIPEVMLDLLRDNLHSYSKLIKRVNLKPVKGKARQNIAGTIPEAIWTEACAKLNELNIVFNQIEVDGYKVGGFIAICNATLEDSDLNLANEILTMLAQSLGLGAA